MSPDLYWPTGVLLALIGLVFVGVASDKSDKSDNGLDVMFVAQLLGILAVPLLLVIPGWVTLRTGLWMCSGVAVLLVLLIVGADMNRPSGSALSTGVQILFLPFVALFLLLYKFFAWLFSKRKT